MVIKILQEKVLLTIKDVKPTSRKFMILGILNPGATRTDDGNIVLYARIIERLVKTEDEKYCYSPRMVGKNTFKIKIDKFNKEMIQESGDTGFIFKDGTKRLTYVSYFKRVVLNKTGFKVLEIDKKPSFFGIVEDGELGVEDPRITKIGNLYVMTYVSLSREQNISTSMATSTDCINWKRRGIIFGEQDKDVVIFPEKINGKYVAFDRPEGNFQFSQPHMWIAYSDNLTSWGGLKPIGCVYEENGFCPRNGAGPPPIKTKHGWLLLYHTVTEFKEEEQEKDIMKKLKKIVKLKSDVVNKISQLNEDMIKKTILYSVGGAMFDLNNPEKLVAKSKSFLIIPDSKHDSNGFENKRVTFPTGLVTTENNNDLLVYSGGADVLITVRKVSLEDILNNLGKIKK